MTVNYIGRFAPFFHFIGYTVVVAKYVLILSCVALIVYPLPTLWRELHAVQYTKTSDVDEIVGFAEIIGKLHDVKDLRDLPESLSVIYDDTLYTDYIRGRILGPKNYVRAVFSAKTARYDNRFSVKMVEEPYPAPIDPKPYLKSIMSDDVYRSWVEELEFLLEGSGCYRGFWRDLRQHVNVVKDWYQQEDNVKKIESFIADEQYAHSKQGRHFREFFEMFIESDNLREVELCCKGLDKGAFYCMSGAALPKGGIYDTWKYQYGGEL